MATRRGHGCAAKSQFMEIFQGAQPLCSGDAFFKAWDSPGHTPGRVAARVFPSSSTCPPFFERIVSTFSEIEYLPTKRDLIVDSTAFRQIKEHLSKVEEGDKWKTKERPALRRGPECDPESPTL